MYEGEKREEEGEKREEKGEKREEGAGWRGGGWVERRAELGKQTL